MTAPVTTRGGIHLPTGMARWLRPVLWTLAAIVALVVLALYVFPTRTWIEQRQSLDEAASALDALEAERETLEARVAALDTPAEIEELAREQFGLVKPGEEAYSVFPSPAPPVDLPPLWPFGDVDAPAQTAVATPGSAAGTE